MKRQILIPVFRAYMPIESDGVTRKGISYQHPCLYMNLHQLVSMVMSGKSYEFMYLVNPSNIETLIEIEGQEGPTECPSDKFISDPMNNGVLMYKNSKGYLKFS